MRQRAAPPSGLEQSDVHDATVPGLAAPRVSPWPSNRVPPTTIHWFSMNWLAHKLPLALVVRYEPLYKLASRERFLL